MIADTVKIETIRHDTLWAHDTLTRNIEVSSNSLVLAYKSAQGMCNFIGMSFVLWLVFIIVVHSTYHMYASKTEHSSDKDTWFVFIGFYAAIQACVTIALGIHFL